MNATMKKNGRPRVTRWAGAAALVAAVVALGWWAFEPRPLRVETATVALGRFEQAIEEDGRLRLKERYLVAAPTAAELARPTLQVGDAVEAGQVVATLVPVAPQMIDVRTRNVLQQRVGSAGAARSAVAAQVARLETALVQARLEADRARQLASDNFIAASARDQAVLAEQSAQRTLDAGRAELRAADFALAEARAALGRADPTAAPAPGRWDLRSPVAGRVVKRHLDSAAPVAVGQPLLEIGDTGALEAVVDVLSGDALRIAPGAAVSLSLGAGAPTLPGRVARIEPVAFTKVSALGIEEQRVNVIVDLDADAVRGAPALGDGFRVDARIVVAAQDRALLVPSAALVRDGARWRVFVVEGGRARSREVELRERNADAAWLDGGVREGETVLLYPGSTMRDGQRVRARD